LIFRINLNQNLFIPIRINSEAEKVKDELADWRDETCREILLICRRD